MKTDRLPRHLRLARMRLARFKKASLLAVSTTGMLIILGESRAEPGASGADSVREATTILQELIDFVSAQIPKIAIALLVFAVFVLANFVIRRILRRSRRGRDVAPMVQVGIYLLGVITAVSILAGDARALLGSLGLVGLALSWSLQTPIESFTGWFLNSIRSYYRTGDRIRVGEVFGDVYQIDYLTTTVWEAGGPGKPVAGAQPTGALVTFPNNEILRSNIVNYTRDFPFVWDEVAFAVANESDLPYTVKVLREAAETVIGSQMTSSVQLYRGLLTEHRLNFDVEDKPQVYLSLAESWTDCTIRYLVDARSRRKWSSLLIEKITAEISRPEHQQRILAGYPQQVVNLKDKSDTSSES